MSSNSNNNPTNKKDPGKLLQKRFGLEAAMTSAFDKVVFGNAPDVWRLLSEERDFCLEVLQSAGVVEGAMAFGLTFFGLNRLPRILARRAARQGQHSKNNSQYKLDKQPSPQQPQQPQQPQKPRQSPFEQPSQTAVKQQVTRSRQRFLFLTMELTFDIGMSLGVGACIAFLRANDKQAEEAFLKVPLQPGRSLIADQICGNLLDEYQRQFRQDENRREILSEPLNRNLQTSIKLAENCRHRQVMEAQLREQQGLSETAPIDIPDTGVIPLSEDPLLTMMLEKDHEQDTTLASAMDVTSWVKDQEEE